jgi:multisubunit Na+/H+ antiporter MnhG subunit
MSLDIRYPIGWMFSLFGVILAAFGLFGDKRIYARSLGININFEAGVGLLVFGLLMLALAWRGSVKAKAAPKPDAKA